MFLEGSNPWLVESIHLSAVFHRPIWQRGGVIFAFAFFGKFEQFLGGKHPAGFENTVFPLDRGPTEAQKQWWSHGLHCEGEGFFFVRMKLDL